MKKAILIFSSGLFAFPFVSVAATDATFITTLVTQVTGIVNTLPPIVIGVAVVVFLWGIISFLTSGDDADQKEKAKRKVVWGLVAILVMVSLWGIIAVLQTVFGIGGGGGGHDLDPLS